MRGSIFSALAGVLEYPARGAEAALDAARALAPSHPAAADGLRALAALDAAALEEAYVAAFDLAPIASPFVGDQLFGASQARHLFLARLGAMQRAAGFDAAPELPDHLAAVLRFAAVAPPSAELDDLVRDGALPAARRMRDALAAAHHPYAGALAAVVEVLDAAVAAPQEALP